MGWGWDEDGMGWRVAVLEILRFSTQHQGSEFVSLEDLGEIWGSGLALIGK